MQTKGPCRRPATCLCALCAWVCAQGVEALFEALVADVPPPSGHTEGPFRMQISSLAWNDHVGRIGCGRVEQGVHRRGESLLCTSTRGLDHRRTNWEITDSVTTRSTQLWVTRG